VRARRAAVPVSSSAPPAGGSAGAWSHGPKKASAPSVSRSMASIFLRSPMSAPQALVRPTGPFALYLSELNVPWWAPRHQNTESPSTLSRLSFRLTISSLSLSVALATAGVAGGRRGFPQGSCSSEPSLLPVPGERLAHPGGKRGLTDKARLRAEQRGVADPSWGAKLAIFLPTQNAGPTRQS
jgi:hypothetical protein